jgi:hypothetical protein
MARFKKIDTSSWPNQIGHNEFVALLKNHLPEVYQEIDETEAGLLHCEMGAFLRVSLESYNENLVIIRRYFDFANEVHKRATPDVLNALNVSYIEGFVLGSSHEQKAREKMPDELKVLYDELVKYFEWLSNQSNA